jgi:hypothetical protein
MPSTPLFTVLAAFTPDEREDALLEENQDADADEERRIEARRNEGLILILAEGKVEKTDARRWPYKAWAVTSL